MPELNGAAQWLPRIFPISAGAIWLCLTASSVVVAASAASWKSKPISRWTAEDANQLLADSPWLKRTATGILPQQSESQLREGGRMGGGPARAHLGPHHDSGLRGTVEIRWESAAPVRAAELKAGYIGAPDWEGEYYAIAVYDVPGITSAVQKSLRSELKQTTWLKRSGKKDVKPAQVDITPSGNNLARVLYLFPRSAELTMDDRRVEFVSQIGRIYVAQSFDFAAMVFQGKLEL